MTKEGYKIIDKRDDSFKNDLNTFWCIFLYEKFQTMFVFP